MVAKILVADDSLTIQKVVRITLADYSYDIIECHTEKDLFYKIESDIYDLILLDYNLSDEKSGEDLAKTVYEKSPSSSIIMMLGTFDTTLSADDEQLALIGVNDKITKPFESNEFIQKCNSIIESKQAKFPPVSEQSTDIIDENKLLNELESWSGDIPSIIGDDLDLVGSLPPIIDSNDPTSVIRGDDKFLDTLEEDDGEMSFESTELIDLTKFQELNKQKAALEVAENNIEIPANKVFDIKKDDENDEDEEDAIIPEASDLEYPDINQESAVESPAGERRVPKFTSLDDLVQDDHLEDDIGDDITDPEFSVSEDINKELEDEIDDEFSADDFWAIDDAGESEEVPDASIEINEADIVEKIKESIAPMLESMIQKYCKEATERIAWEIIPDLAENIIKKELEELASTVRSNDS